MSEEIELQTLLTKLLIDDLEKFVPSKVSISILNYNRDLIYNFRKKTEFGENDDEVVEIDRHNENLEAKYVGLLNSLFVD